MKDCPQCGSKNEDTNLFCPMCGNSFVSRKKEPDAESAEATAENGRSGRKGVVLAAIAFIMIGLGAGVVGYFVAKGIEGSNKVVVETGSQWECSECGDVYRSQIFELEVEKKDSDLYGVETVSGTCHTCLYGPLVGEYQDFLDYLSGRDFFPGQFVQIDPAAAGFMMDNEALFPAPSAESVIPIALEEDPRRVHRDFEDLAGNAVHVSGEVVNSNVFEMRDGTKMSYIHLVPLLEGKKLPIEYLVFQQGVSPLLAGDAADCYLLPVDLVEYRGEDHVRQGVLCIGMFLSGGLPE